MTAADVIEVVGRLRAAGIEFWIEGGWGIDALLRGQTRPHDDLDLGVRSDDVEAICGVLHEFARSDLEWPASFVLTDPRKRRVDCHPLAFDEHGDGWQPQKSGGPPYRWPRAGLGGVGEIGGLEVPCITPELQVRWHMYPEFDDVDWQDLQHLARRFGLELPLQHHERPGFLAPKRGLQP